MFYPYGRTEWPVWPWTWGLALAAVTAGVVWRARRMPWLFVGWSWFLGTLVPVIGVVQVGGQATADRYAYLPHIGLFIAVFWTAADVGRRWPRAWPWLTAVATAGAVGCTALAWQQTGYWRDSSTLYEHTATLIRPTGRIYRMLGDALVEADHPGEAARAYRQAWDAGPRDLNLVAAWSRVLLQQARWAELTAVLGPMAKDSTPDKSVLNNLALALDKQGRGDEAADVYRRCLSLYPNYAMAHFGFGKLLEARGETRLAMDQYEAGLATRNDWVPALTRLAWLYARDGDGPLRERAFDLAGRAVGLSGGRDPGSLDALAAAAGAAGHWDDAVQAAQAALELACQPGAPPGAADLCRARLESYRQHRLPST